MTTVRELISSSLRLINVSGAGEGLTAEDGIDALNTLNQMIASWAADGATIYTNSVDSLNLTANVGSYTMGPGGSISGTRPVYISNATITNQTITTPLNLWRSNVISSVEYTFQGVPTDLYINNTNPLIQLQLNPLPISALIMTIYSQKPQGAFLIGDTIDMPPGYEMALRFNLAVILAPEYEREAHSTVREFAADSLATIKRNNLQYTPATMAVDAALDPKYTNQGYYFSGYYGWY